jgi:mRNA interferase RelE/StbE
MASAAPYFIEVTPHALRQLSGLPRKEQERLAARIGALAGDPRPHGVEKLKGTSNEYRIRVRAYRVIYAIHDDRLVVSVLQIAHRRDVYRKRKKKK